MEILAEIEALLYIHLNADQIKALIERAYELGFSFISREAFPVKQIPINKQEVLDAFLKYDQGQGASFASVQVKHKDTFFSLYVSYVDACTQISIYPSCINWFVYWDVQKVIDVDRYIRLLLDLCKGFPIKKIEAGELFPE